MSDDETFEQPHSSNAFRRGGKEAAVVRAARALELRMAGASYLQIAAAVGYASKSAAHDAVQRALDAEIGASSEVREKYRRLQLARCQRLVRAIWPKCLGGDPIAIGAAVRVLEREARLMGLDVPAEVHVSVKTNDALRQLLDEIEAMLVEQGAIEPIEPAAAVSGGSNGDEGGL